MILLHIIYGLLWQSWQVIIGWSWRISHIFHIQKNDLYSYTNDFIPGDAMCWVGIVYPGVQLD